MKEDAYKNQTKIEKLDVEIIKQKAKITDLTEENKRLK